ncbi:MAG: alpha/beta fold hydrolase [Acidimicrobiia bacterium]
MKLRAVGVAFLVVLAAACSTDGKAASESGSLWWKDCGSNGAQCATLSVPLDYATPEGERVSLALVRYKATAAGKRKGALLLNPGGPGASGVAFLRGSGRDVVAPSVAAIYDLVAWDPRGTGDSLPTDCGDRLDYLFDGVTYAPSTDAQRSALVAANKRFAEACRARMGSKLAFVGSRETVQDMERIRIALGEDRLNYLGFSYGTYLGAEYANAHPDRLGRVVLDGAVNPALSAAASVVEQTGGFEKSIDAFFAACGAKLPCTWTQGQAPKAALLALAAQVTATPVPVSFGEAVGPAQLDIGMAAMLYAGTSGWETLNGALNALVKGDGERIYAAFSSYVGRGANGKYDTSYSAFLAIGCVDGPPIGTPEQTLAFAAENGRAFPVFGTTSVNLNIACSMWPVPPTGAPGPVSAPGAEPMLVLGSTGDPATPLAWGEALAQQLASAVLITAPGEQHTVYRQGSRCVDDRVNRYLLSGAVPDATLRCAA